MTYINRGCVIVRVRDPYMDWARTIDDSDLLPDPENDEPSVYLIPNFDTEDEAWELLAACYEFIFEEELDAWHSDETDWPEARTFELFKQWFAISFCSGVQDLAAEELVHEADT